MRDKIRWRVDIQKWMVFNGEYSGIGGTIFEAWANYKEDKKNARV